MLNLHGPTSFHWANDKGRFGTILAKCIHVLVLYNFLQILANCFTVLVLYHYSPQGTTALHMAVKERHLTLVRFLLEDGKCDPSPRMRRDGWTPLHTAANRRENIKMIRMLVMYGADVNAA